MISYIRGELAAVEEDRIIVEAGGIGYRIFMSGTSMGRLPSVGSQVKIHTYFSVKEDSMQLFGFLTRDDLDVYRLLIGVSGIGPKGGLNILSALSADELRFAVLSGDAKAISAAPGIGKKTAEKLILELKDKLSLEDALGHAGEEPAAAGAGPQLSGSVQNDAVQALVALGYGSTESLKAVRQIEVTDDMQVEDVLKQALKFMMF